jgi:hypothetical protein
MRSFAKVVVALTLVACGGDDGGSDPGTDTFPKTGDEPGDPTIVSAAATCELEGNMPFIVVNVEALDPMGAANLGDCSGKIGSVSQQGSFSGGCSLSFEQSCTIGQSVIVELTVGNKSGGETTASVTLMLLQ